MLHTLCRFFYTACDLILPRHQEVLEIAEETPSSFTRFYAPHHFRGITAISHYQKIPVRSAIHAAKFYKNHHASKLLASLLDRHLASLPSQTIVVPIPLSTRRKRGRGHNQIVSILNDCVHPLAKQHDPLLTRTRETKAQSHLLRSERLKNVRNCFHAKFDPDLPPDAHFLIIDDVTTTGATLEEAAASLRKAYPKATISCLALAH